MLYTFEKADLNAIQTQFNAYLASLTGPVDDFWEDHVCQGRLHAICRNGKTVGFFGVIPGNEPRLTSFFVDDTVSTRDSEEIFERVLREFGVTHAFVVTCDELFLSLCMTCQKKVEIQAYFFDVDNTANVRPAEFGSDCIKRVTAQELPEVHVLTDHFFANDFAPEDIERGTIELYRAVKNGETLGFGVMIPDKLTPHFLPCGEIVLEAHREKGVARSLQLFMHQRCRELGKTHIGGCWFGNKPSRNTFDSMGLYSHTRLLNIHF